MKQLVQPVNSYDNFFGNDMADIELVEYGDYECPYCGLAFPIVKDLQRKMGSSMRFVFRNFPLRKIHPNAFGAAVAAEAASLQNKFWEMHDIIFQNQRKLDEDYIILYAMRVGLDIDRFRSDIQEPILKEKVENDFDSGMRSGVNRTPTFFVNGYKYEGDWMGDQLYQYLQGLLNGASLKL